MVTFKCPLCGALCLRNPLTFSAPSLAKCHAGWPPHISQKSHSTRNINKATITKSSFSTRTNTGNGQYYSRIHSTRWTPWIIQIGQQHSTSISASKHQCPITIVSIRRNKGAWHPKAEITVSRLKTYTISVWIFLWSNRSAQYFVSCCVHQWMLYNRN